jgi:hypothetical protein
VKTLCLASPVVRISGVPGDEWTTRDDDLAMQSAVLERVLELPVHVTVEELIRELAGEEPDFGPADAIRRAARDLSGVGLIHLQGGGFVSPTRAALRYNELLDR